MSNASLLPLVAAIDRSVSSSGIITDYLFTTDKQNSAALVILGPSRKETLAPRHTQAMRALWEEKKDEWLYFMSWQSIYAGFDYSQVVLITGLIKTTKCAAAVFKDRGRHALSITDRLGLVTARVESENGGDDQCSAGPYTRVDGPDSRTKMQCIFIHGLKGKKFLGAWRLSAFAEPQDPDASGKEPGRDQRVLASMPGPFFSEPLAVSDNKSLPITLSE